MHSLILNDAVEKIQSSINSNTGIWKKSKKNYNKYLSTTNHMKNFIWFLNPRKVRSHRLIINEEVLE
jgi:hypothetical protein